MPAAKTTIYDVADAAGVAISTVSRVLNDSPEVSASTRARVRDAINRLNFQPQRTARLLASKDEPGLAVAMPSFTSLFYVEILKGVKDVMRERGDSDLLLCNLGSLEPEESLRRFLSRGAVGGLLLASLRPDADMRRNLQRMQAPVVLLGAEDDAFDSLWWDDAAGAELATAHLLKLGHRRIGLITAQPWSQSAEPRLEGYRRALEASGVPYDPDLVVKGDTHKHAGYSEEAGAEAMAKLWALDPRPTAVFAASDVQAFGAWSFARDTGIRVPRDLSLVGYDNLKLSRFLDLTTVDQGMQTVGRRAAEHLVARMAGEAPRLHESLDVQLVARGSSAPPA